MAHAANQLPDGSYLVWVDVDSSVEQAFDKKFYSYASDFDLVYIVEVLCRRHLENVTVVDEVPAWCKDFKIETGVFLISVNPNTRRFLNRALMWYNGPMLALAEACLVSAESSSQCSVNWIRNNIGLNDVFVLNLLMHQDGRQNLEQGWFANKPFLCEEHFENILGHCSVCVAPKPPTINSTKRMISPFFIEDYITHHHDASGIMTLLHDTNHFPPNSKVVNEFLKTRSYCDPRLL